MSGSSVFDVGVHLSATDGISGVLAGIGKHFLGLNSSVKELEHGLSRLKVGVIGGFIGAAGVELMHIASHLERSGEALVHAKTLFAAGLPEFTRAASMAQVTAAAWAEAGSNMNTSVQGNVEALHDLYNVVQDIPHAMKLLPSFNLMGNALSAVKEHGGTVGHEGSNESLARAAMAFELQGKTTGDALEEMSKDFTKTIIALRGRVDGSKYFQAVSTSGDARLTWNEDFATKVMPALINSMGIRAGRAINQLSNNLFGGVSSSEFQGKFQEKWGIHTAADELRDDKGKFKGFKVGSMWHSEEFRDNSLDWANSYRSHLKEMGIDVEDVKVMGQVIAEIGRGNTGLKTALDELLMPGPNRQLNKEVHNIGGVSDDAVGLLNANDPRQIRAALSKQWANLTQGIGEQLVQPLMDNILKPITSELRDISQWVGSHPDDVKNIAEDIVSLGAGMTALGTIMAGGALLSVLGPTGLLVGALAAVATFAGTMSAIAGDATPDHGFHKPNDMAGADVQFYRSVDNALAFVSEKTATVIRNIGADASTRFPAIWGRIEADAAQRFPAMWHNLEADAATRFPAMWHNLQADFTSRFSHLTDGWEDIVAKIRGPFDAMKSVFQAFANSIEGLVGSLRGKLSWLPGFHEDEKPGAAANDNMKLDTTGPVGALHDRLAKSMGLLDQLPQLAAPKITTAVTGIGTVFGGDVSKLPGMVSGAISSAIGAIGAQLRSAIAGLAGTGVQVPNSMRTAPPMDVGQTGFIRYRGGSPTVSPGSPGRGGMTTAMNLPPVVIEHHHTTVLDGKVIARAVTREQVAMNKLHRSVGGMDGQGSYLPPGGDVGDAA